MARRDANLEKVLWATLPYCHMSPLPMDGSTSTTLGICYGSLLRCLPPHQPGGDAIRSNRSGVGKVYGETMTSLHTQVDMMTEDKYLIL